MASPKSRPMTLDEAIEISQNPIAYPAETIAEALDLIGPDRALAVLVHAKLRRG